MGRKKESSIEGEAKRTTIPEFLAYLTTNKKKWEELSEADRKIFHPFIINKWLSMDLYMCEAINELQQYTVGMDKDKFWRVFYELLPKEKIYFKYIKAKEIEGIAERDIKLLQKHFKVDENYSIQYLQILNKTEEGMKELETIRHSYQYEKLN